MKVIRKCPFCIKTVKKEMKNIFQVKEVPQWTKFKLESSVKSISFSKVKTFHNLDFIEVNFK